MLTLNLPLIAAPGQPCPPLPPVFDSGAPDEGAQVKVPGNVKYTNVRIRR